MRFSAVFHSLCSVTLGVSLFATAVAEAAPARRKTKPPAAKSAPAPRLTNTQVLARELALSSFSGGDGLEGCTPQRFSRLATALQINEELLTAPQGEFETTAHYAERRALLTRTLAKESMVICETLADNPDVTFKYDADRQVFEGSFADNHNVWREGKSLGSYRAKTAMGVAFTVKASVDLEYDLDLKLYANGARCLGDRSYSRTFTVPAASAAAPALKSAGKIAYVVRLAAPYVAYTKSEGNPRLDDPYDNFVHNIRAYARLEKVLIVDGGGEPVWTCDVGTLAPMQPPRPIGDATKWVSVSDYPVQGYSLRLSGLVRATLSVDDEGKVIGCEILATSGSALLDKATCDGWRKSANFIPATDESGLPVAGTFIAEKMWSQYGL